MEKYKISVYAISKNEEKFVDRWVNSIKEADEIVVLDTGSTDDTVKKLKSRGVKVYSKQIKPWRFDVARNESLKLVSKDTDICICLDLDEVILPGWRENIEKIWKENTTRLRYNYNWKLDENNQPLINFYIDKIHLRNGYEWTHPVHEVLKYLGSKEEYVTTDDIIVNHYPDSTKSRSSYLPLLELSVKEDPEDDRNMHYLGREYMYYGKWNECIDTLIKHLSLPSSTWKDERCASMRFIGRSYKNLKRYEEARMWFNKAIEEAPYLRDGYAEMAILEYELGNYDKCIKCFDKVLEIKKDQKTYINEIISTDGFIYDVLAICYFNIGNVEKSYECIKKVLEEKPNDKRLLENMNIIEKRLS